VAIRKKAGAINYLQYKDIAIRSQAIADRNSFAFKHSRINLLCFLTSQIEFLFFIIILKTPNQINKNNK
jgi:hypothetical protein